MKSFDIPILLLVFNRPKLTKIVLNRIREKRPKYLFIAADGPRKNQPEDAQKCSEVREIVDELIDWPCEVKTLYRDENLGCRNAVSSAINWFFQEVEMGIIIEDDVLPDLNFFHYAKNLLEIYKDDERIMMISGFNHFGKWNEKKQPYHFVFYGGVWGWATWRRAWKKYDIDMTAWSEPNIKDIISGNLGIPQAYLIEDFETLSQCYKGLIDTWDYQWRFTRFYQNGLTIVPSQNLVKNIGFGKEATHTRDIDSVLNNASTYSTKFNDDKLPIKHAKGYDVRYIKMFLDNKFKERQSIGLIMKKNIKRLLNIAYNWSPADYAKFIAKNLKKSKVEDVSGSQSPIPKWVTVSGGYGNGINLFVGFHHFSNWGEMVNGEYDKDIFDSIFKKDLDLTCIWDVGAHFGYHSLIFSKNLSENGKVISFEPNPFNRQRFMMHLDRNSELSNKIQMLPFALSDFDGKVMFKMSDDVDSSISTGSHLTSVQAPRAEELYDKLGFNEVEVDCKSADVLIQEKGLEKPQLIKVDIEGAEFNFLQGARQLIIKDRPHLIIEIHNILAMYDVLNFLRDNGYKSEVIDRGSATLSRCFITASPKD